jgi:hypothetical protein
MQMITDILDSGGLRVTSYLVVAAVALTWWRRERRHPELASRSWWPTYWLTSAVLAATMAAGRLSSLDEIFGELGREQARSGGWYDARRPLQVVAVVVVGTVWLVGVVIAIWRVPPRRRRYLPHAVVLSTVVGFALVRMISLHQIDAVLYRRDLGGVRIVSVVELTLLAVTALVGIASAPVPHRVARPTTDADLPLTGRTPEARSGSRPV